jgi:Electron transfer DM13
MNIFGDIERLFAELWPFRVPLAIGAIVVIATVGYIAWRRGWVSVARAHPRTSVVAIVLVLAIVGPLGWVLGSPLFTRTELVEPAVAQAASTAGASTALASGSTLAPGTTLASGTWSGADDFHFGRGRALLSKSADGSLRLSLEDFSVLNGPDLFVYVSSDPNGWTENAVNLGELKATDGSFSYEIPPELGAADIASAVVWCRAFGVLFASAPLVPVSA